MTIIAHQDDDLEKWRDGVMTQMRVSALLGSHQICIFDQFCEPGLGAPKHLHAVEEVLEIFGGTAEVWLNNATHILTANHSVIIPPGHLHGFRNVGDGTLHVRATLAACIFEASYEKGTDVSRRYVPDL